MSDAHYWLDEYKREVDQLRLQVDKLRSLVDSSNTKAVELASIDIEAKLNRVREVKKSFGLELRLVRDRKERTDCDNESRLLDQRVDECAHEFSRLKANSDKGLLIGNQPAISDGGFAYSTEGKNNDTLLSEAHRLQDLTGESLLRTRNMIEASKEVGTATLETLRAQKDQILDITNEVDKIDSNLDRATQLIGNFTRRMATDRLIQLFGAFNIVVLLGLILYVGISGRSLTASGGNGKSIFGPSQLSPTRMPTIPPTISPTISPTLSPTTPASQFLEALQSSAESSPRHKHINHPQHDSFRSPGTHGSDLLTHIEAAAVSLNHKYVRRRV